MNKFIIEQLNKVKNVNLPEYNESTTTIVIPRDSGSGNIVGNTYKVQLEDYIIRPYEGFTLHENWNNNIIPTDTIMNIEVTDQMGKMIKVTGIGVNDRKVWSGWLPRAGIKKIIERI